MFHLTLEHYEYQVECTLRLLSSSNEYKQTTVSISKQSLIAQNLQQLLFICL